eukprot:TRINITY_DN9984_c0_g1_i1.p1 TRINITY_DN9984_c0_g1~~TRINITY_DN9984_c0_g1_i1.p1  ORF type:complete len:124 (+),score=9.54 TRINITY_DN9984_c0_g1_i1:47-373(+)
MRNRMTELNLRLSMGMLGLACSSTIASVFGMNLLHHFEEHPYAFYGVTGILFTAGFATWFRMYEKFSRYDPAIAAKANRDLTDMLDHLHHIEHIFSTRWIGPFKKLVV